MSELNINNFDELVLKSEKPVVLDFWASWCNPCRIMSPIVDEVAESVDEVNIYKVNVNEQKEIADKYAITSIPTMLYIKDGIVSDRLIGLTDKKQLRIL